MTEPMELTKVVDEYEYTMEAEYLYKVIDSDFRIKKENKKKVRKTICNFFCMDDDKNLSRVLNEVLNFTVEKDEAGDIVCLDIDTKDKTLVEWEDLPEFLVVKDVFNEIASSVEDGSWIEYQSDSDSCVRYKFCFKDKKLITHIGKIVYKKELSHDEQVQEILDENKKVSYIACVDCSEKARFYGVTFPDFPGCVSAGTQDELLFMATEALTLHIKGMQEDGDKIPSPTSFDLLDWEKADPKFDYTMLVEVTV